MFENRIKALKSRCPDDFVVYVTVPHEEPGACPVDEVDSSRHVIGRVGDPVDELYAAWIDEKCSKS